MALAAGTRLGPYEILAPIGAGGMGEVYRARDKKLDRDVAIKVLPESVAADSDALARFEREAKAVAALSHPNILAIHDFGTHDGISYAVMELLEGSTLREKLNKGPISQKQAVEYALQVAKGLSAAHERGIVHRDLKPENLFVSKDGHVKILDFGLAKRTAEAVSRGQTDSPTLPVHTEPGTVMGTVGYMSPEQVMASQIDHRSDIFSFGAVFYEILSGKRAFHRDSHIETLTAILRDDPPELSGPRRIIPPAIDRIVRHCLEKDRDDRFHSAHDIVFALREVTVKPEGVRDHPIALRRLLVATGAILAIALGILLFGRVPNHGAVEARGKIQRVAVLPFENLGSPEDDYFADGIADDVRSKLTTLHGVEVIARGSSTPYKRTAKTPVQIARELNVGFLLTATVRWQKGVGANRVHVTPELVEVRDSGTPASKWQQPFDAALTDVFQVQSDIATKVTQALGVALGAADTRRLSEKPTQDIPAYDAFLRGEEASNHLGSVDPPSLRRALGFYEQAVALDPTFEQAWAQLGRTSSLLYSYSTPSASLAKTGREAAEKAESLAPDRSDGYLALGNYRLYVTREYPLALEQYERGRIVAPNNADLLTATAEVERRLGRWEEALDHLLRSERLDPLSVLTKQRLGGTFLRLRRLPEARKAIEAGLSLAPANLFLVEVRGLTLLAQGDLPGARSLWRSASKVVAPTALVAHVSNFEDLAWTLDEDQLDLLVRLTPSAFDDNRATWALCLTEAYALKRDATNARVYAEEARAALENQIRATPDLDGPHAALGLAFAFLGFKEEAIREGKRATEILPVAKDAYFGPYIQHQLVRIFILVGEPEKALDQLEPLLKIPYFLTPAFLRIDPAFDPLRTNPRFQKLVAGAK